MDLNNNAIVEVSNPTITSTGTITISEGTYTQNGSTGTYDFTNIDVQALGIWNVTAAYDPVIRGNINNDGVFTGCNGNGCDYTFLSNSGVISGNSAFNAMSDLIFNDGAVYTNTNSAGLNVTDGLETTSGTGSFINGLNALLLYGGTTGGMTITNFTASANPNTVVYNRTTSNQLIESTTDGEYHHLIVNKAVGIDLTTNSELIVNGDLSLISGDLIMGAQNLIIAELGDIQNGSAASYIQQTGTGRLIKEYPTALFSDELSIPLGDASTYAPITFTLNSGSTVSSGAEISFEYNNASGHPDRDNDNTASGGDDDNDSGGTVATNYLNDYWEFDLTNISDIDFSATCDFSNGGIVGSTSSMFPVILRTATPPSGSSTIDWHVVGTIADKGTGSVGASVVTFTGINDVLNTTDNWVLYAMDNADNGNGDERLPVSLISFDAHVVDDGVELTWSTADEDNNDYFTIERSLDGFDFDPLMTVDGAGDSDTRLDYQAIDHFPLEGRSYYRLKQTDHSGDFSYSSVVSVYFEKASQHSLSIRPNIGFKGDLITVVSLDGISNQELLGIEILDLTGKYFKVKVDQNHFQIPYHISVGLCLVKIVTVSQVFTKKLLIK